MATVSRSFWDGSPVPATEPFPWLDLEVRAEDSAERLVRRFFDACESPEKRVRTNRLLRRAAKSSLRGTVRYSVINKMVSNRFSRMMGIDSRAKKMQLITAHLLGLAYIRYVFKLEPIASMDLEELISISVPVVNHYLENCPSTERFGDTELYPPGEDRFGLRALR
jgi:hypothetical protein